MNRKFVCGFLSLSLMLCTTAMAGAIKIGHQYFDVRPISVQGPSQISAVGMPAPTAQLVMENIVETEPGKYSIIIRDRLVIAYFIGSLNSRGLLTDNIIYTCRTKKCNPTGKQEFEINKHTHSYAVKADNLEEWYQLINLLESDPQIRAVFPTFIRDAKQKYVIKNVQGLQEKNYYNSAEDD